MFCDTRQHFGTGIVFFNFHCGFHCVSKISLFCLCFHNVIQAGDESVLHILFVFRFRLCSCNVTQRLSTTTSGVNTLGERQGGGENILRLLLVSRFRLCYRNGAHSPSHIQSYVQ